MTAMTAIGNAREGDGDHVAVLQRVLRADEGWSSRERIALTAAIAAMQAQQGADLKGLQRFAVSIIGDEEIGDRDGGDIQDAAEACGLLVPTEVTAACGEACRCVEYGDFPQTCYRYSDTLKRAYAATGAPR